MDMRKGLICFVPAQMLMSWCTCKMVVNIQTKHDAKTNFFYLQSWCEISEVTYPLNICMRITCDSHTNLISELQFFMIPIPTLIPLGLIPILIPIPRFTKICDSNSDSDSSVSQKTWFQFRFKQTRLWFRFWFWNHLQLCNIQYAELDNHTSDIKKGYKWYQWASNCWN